jgi:signal transduction histidine kinase
MKRHLPGHQLSLSMPGAMTADQASTVVGAAMPVARLAPVSIRQRLAQALLQVSLVWAVAVAGAVALVAHAEVDHLLDGALQESAEILLGVLSLNADRLPLDSGGALPAPLHHERLVWQLVSADARVLMRSHDAPAQPLLPVLVHGLQDATDGARVYGLAFGPANATLYVAQTSQERTEATRNASVAVALAALAIALMCAVWLRRRARLELLPLRELSLAVQAYHPLEPGAALAPAPREELAPIRDAIVDLGERLALRVDSERAITAHAAHALRTPLAGMTAQLAVAMRECPPALQPRLLRVRQASERLSRVVAALLTLFRSGVEPQLQEVELGALVRGLPVDGLRVELSGMPCLARVDPDLMTAALLNLLDNAVRYGANAALVQFSQRNGPRGTLLVLRMVDDGPGVPAAKREQMQQSLLDQSYEQAMGLGLMLADLVARAHRGRLALVGTPSGFGLEISWPLMPLTGPGAEASTNTSVTSA